MKAHRGIAVVLGVSNGYLTVHEAKEERGRPRENILGYIDIVTVLVPLVPCSRRSILTRLARGIQTRTQDVSLVLCVGGELNALTCI